jgi:hypothetical protein
MENVFERAEFKPQKGVINPNRRDSQMSVRTNSRYAKE